MENNSTIKFLKIRKVKTPFRAYKYDAGIDFFVPEFDKNFIKDLKNANEQLNKHNNVSYNDNSLLVNSSSATLTISSDNSSNKGGISYKMNDSNDTIIKFDEEKGENYFLLYPHQRINIPSGLKLRMENPNRALIAANKSGIASKKGLIFGAQVVDYSYKGEIHINVINTSTEVARIYENMKLIQFLETPIFNSDIEVTNLSDTPINKFYKGMIDDRGDKGFGSSDNMKKTDKSTHLNS